jgi:serine/threonine-protein kinase
MSQTLSAGSKLKGRYLIERELGRGGIGVVYLARDERLHGMPVVIKFLLDLSVQNEWLTKKFMHEAEALTRINHPGVVRVIDRDEDGDGRPFFVMEFIDGRPLRQVMRPEGMEMEYVALLSRQIGHALHAAHRQGVFHRDLKPENVMLQNLSGSQEQVKLIDFGIAKVLDSQSGAATEVAVVAGSQQYIAPEQLLSQPITAATDIYSFAIIVYEMLTGRRPFSVSAPNQFLALQELVKLQQSQSFVKPKTFRPDLPDAVQILLLNALSFDAQLRPQNAQVFADDLARALMGQVKAGIERTTIAVASPGTQPGGPETEVVAAKQKSPVIPPVETKTKSGKARAAILAGIALVAAAIVAVYFWSKRAEPVPMTVETPAPERLLNYSITLQKDPERYPGSKPFQLPGEVVFSPGDRVRFTFGSPQSGFLYIINESPPASGTESKFNILFPSPTSNQGSSRLDANRQIIIPERGEGFVFDEESGAEKLWLIWSATAIDQLEVVKGWANPQDKGEIKDAKQIGALRDFLAKSSRAEPNSHKDDTTKQTALKNRGELMIKLVKLEHH